ncbi:hypothetical protein A6A08_15280 [Nocardiopsis sp. TSRI0078]|uniref:hypothetical protein n=1 Tax=unclassified Nocardiopsis TaxID=2649073 RepID=UPI00094051B8|nr:hypothetical protein [Nocardiopsis sp. TSRI0078]OKI13643.1 hypothetical protein A6A08_15280 [Nocardiopsis sp. TSRI0078]
MMALLRSRKTMFVLAGLVVVGLVVSAAVGLFNAIGTAPVATPPQGQGPQDGGQGPQDGGAAPEAPPDTDVLGQAPSGLAYVSDPEGDVYCEQGECVRLVMVMTEGGELPEDSRETVETVVSHLTERGWEEQQPQGARADQVFLSDGEHMLADTSAHDDPESPAVLMLGDAGEAATP